VFIYIRHFLLQKNLLATLSSDKSGVIIFDKKWVELHFLAFFSPTHLVTLLVTMVA
jgi:hypothetical protein